MLGRDIILFVWDACTSWTLSRPGIKIKLSTEHSPCAQAVTYVLWLHAWRLGTCLGCGLGRDSFVQGCRGNSHTYSIHVPEHALKRHKVYTPEWCRGDLEKLAPGKGGIVGSKPFEVTLDVFKELFFSTVLEHRQQCTMPYLFSSVAGVAWVVLVVHIHRRNL